MADVLFLALSVLTIGAAIAALELRSLIYGSIALMGTLGGIAGFFTTVPEGPDGQWSAISNGPSGSWTEITEPSTIWTEIPS